MANASSGIEWKTLSEDSVRSLLGPQPTPCLSLYLPTHRNVPENRVDRPRYRHLVESLELALALARPRADVERLLHPFRVLDGDHAFWEHTHDGLAIFAADGLARGFVLERPVAPLALVTNRFHVLPLVRLAAALERWTVLALTSRVAIVYATEAWHDLAGGPAARRPGSLPSGGSNRCRSRPPSRGPGSSAATSLTRRSASHTASIWAKARPAGPSRR